MNILRLKYSASITFATMFFSLFFIPIGAQAQENTLNTTTTDSTSESNFNFSNDNTFDFDSSFGETQSSQFLQYNDESNNFSISYPSNWDHTPYEKPENATVYSVVEFYPPASEDPTLRTYVAVGIEELSFPQNLNQYMRSVAESYSANSANFSLVSSNEIDLPDSDLPAYEIMFSDTVDGVKMRNIEIGILNESFSKVNYIYLSAPEQDFNNFEPIYREMVNSFSLGDISDSTFDFGNNNSFNDFASEGDFESDMGDQLSQFMALQFLDSFSNSIFNGTSYFASFGTSLVEGVKVSGISLSQDSDKLFVNLRGSPTDDEISDINIIAMRIPFSIQELLTSSLLTSSMGFDSFGTTTEDPISSFSNFDDQANMYDMFNPFEILSSIQIGSSSIVNPDWTSPQSTTLDLVGGQNNNTSNSTSAGVNVKDDIIIVTVIPYTGQV